MNTDIQKVALRQKAVWISRKGKRPSGPLPLTGTTSALVANCAKLGFALSEDLLAALEQSPPSEKLALLDLLKEVTGVNKNWTPLVRQWDQPTGESILDHVVTLFANLFQGPKGTRLACGHLIPENTFPLERYNGCPFCGTPFDLEKLEWEGGHSKLKTLRLWSDEDLDRYRDDLLASPVALDATQAEDLKTLLKYRGTPQGIEVRMKETLVLVVDALVELDRAMEAKRFFKTPTDILRYLWYKHTGFLQLVEPKVIARRISKNASHLHPGLDQGSTAKIKALKDLKLKFTRAECRRYAAWLNALPMSAAAACESMHPKREIWVRVIRALRLAEYSQRKGFEMLRRILDLFYNERYPVWQGKLNAHKLNMDSEGTFALLKQRPGLFARSLFSTMLWFGPDLALQHFGEVLDQVPARLVFTLQMYAEQYFDPRSSRTVKPLGGTHKRIPANKLLQLYPKEELVRMQELVRDLGLEAIRRQLARVENLNQTIYIDPGLDKIPIAIGDRSEQVQDLPGALMGTRFPVEGDTVRLFLQWGKGLPAQHLDMDLSCRVSYVEHSEFCSFSQLTIPGCQHSGDIRSIPHQVGTAEYIDLDVAELERRGAQYVSFTCNAYSNGSLSPNLVVGWMNSQFPMKISQKGVAYDPTAVQHQVRIGSSLAKGLLFGVLDVPNREIIWMEMAFGGQLTQNLDLEAVATLLQKLDAKLKIGALLRLKAEVQGLEVVKEPEGADEVYTVDWALNVAEVSGVFLG